MSKYFAIYNFLHLQKYLPLNCIKHFCRIFKGLRYNDLNLLGSKSIRQYMTNMFVFMPNAF